MSLVAAAGYKPFPTPAIFMGADVAIFFLVDLSTFTGWDVSIHKLGCEYIVHS
jgi:hypothetical protein